MNIKIKLISITFSAPYIAPDGELYVNMEYGTNTPPIVCRVVGVFEDGLMYQPINDVL